MEERKKIRIAAVGDIHVRETDQGKWKDFFKKASEMADILVLTGDLTDTGKLTEAEVLKEELKHCTIPVVAVLGNHDYERDQQKAIKHLIEGEQVTILNGESTIIKGIGFAGIKGFGGGFDNHMLALFGESMMKQFVQEAVDESLKLDRALVRLESEDQNIPRVVILHYSPIKSTVIGEPEQIFPFLGSSRLSEPINRRDVSVVFHGHAHIGKLQGETSKGIKVYNVAKQVIQKAGIETPFFLYEI